MLASLEIAGKMPIRVTNWSKGKNSWTRDGSSGVQGYYKILREKKREIFETYSLSSRSVQIVDEMYVCTYVSKLTE